MNKVYCLASFFLELTAPACVTSLMLMQHVWTLSCLCLCRSVNQALGTFKIYEAEENFTLTYNFALSYGGSADEWSGLLPWDPETPGSRPVMTTLWIWSW